MGRREEKNRQTKAAIVSAALRLFAERGYDAVTVDEITAAAGVAKGTFYTHFTVKSDIIVEEFWRIDAFYADFARDHLHEYATATEKLAAFTRAQMSFVRDQIGNANLKLLYANQTLLTGRERVIVDPRREWYRIIESIIVQGQGEGVFRRDRPASTLAQEFNRSMRSVFLDWCITDAGFDLVEEGLRYLEEWLLPGLANRGGAKHAQA